jgi:hypothetical protein
MYKIMVVYRFYQASSGVALTSQVIEFDTEIEANIAVVNLLKPGHLPQPTVVKLYTE